MIGALVFLGCPWRGYLRLSGGDWNAIYGLLGLFLGIGIGTFFLTRGFSLGRARVTSAAAGWIMPVFVVALLAALIAAPLFGRDTGRESRRPDLLLRRGAWFATRAAFAGVGRGTADRLPRPAFALLHGGPRSVT